MYLEVTAVSAWAGARSHLEVMDRSAGVTLARTVADRGMKYALMGEQTASLSQMRSTYPPSPAASDCSGGTFFISIRHNCQYGSRLCMSAAISSRVEPGGIISGCFAQESAAF